MSFRSELDEIKEKATSKGIDWDSDLFQESFGKGTYRWIIDVMGISYGDGMYIGLFDLHQHYSREDME